MKRFEIERHRRGSPTGSSTSTSTTSRDRDDRCTDTIDLSDHDAFVDARPARVVRTLRREDPCPLERRARRAAASGRSPATHDIREVHRNGEISRRRSAAPRSRTSTPEQHRGAQVDDRHGPAAPRRAARLIAHRFTPRAVQRIGGRGPHGHRRRPRHRAASWRSSTSSREIAAEIPMQVFAEILGVPQDERRYIIELGDRLLGNQDPEYTCAATTRTGSCRSRARRAGDVRVRPQAGRRRGASTRATTSSPSSRSSR